MPRFRKKPVIIEAEQYHPGVKTKGVEFDSIDKTPFVTTMHLQETIYSREIAEASGLYQIVYIYPGDWIIPEPDGIHFYPCKPDVFENTYEPVNEPSDYAPETTP